MKLTAFEVGSLAAYALVGLERLPEEWRDEGVEGERANIKETFRKVIPNPEIPLFQRSAGPHS